MHVRYNSQPTSYHWIFFFKKKKESVQSGLDTKPTFNIPLKCLTIPHCGLPIDLLLPVPAHTLLQYLPTPFHQPHPTRVTIKLPPHYRLLLFPHFLRHRNSHVATFLFFHFCRSSRF